MSWPWINLWILRKLMAEYPYITLEELRDRRRSVAKEETAVQDGMLQYFNEATKLTDWYGTQESNRKPFDYKWYYGPRKPNQQ
jgi:hypothetical protein